MRKLLAPVAALALLLGMVSTVFGWQATLASDCAPDPNHFAWKINLITTENTYLVELSFDEDFEDSWEVDFLTKGLHSFTTERDGETLYFRWSDAKGKADADGDLCKEPDIHITKSNDTEGTVPPGTEVTYTYEVENTGDLPLDDVEVIDQLVGGDPGIACDVDSGDYTESDSDNGILDVGETWTFTCTTTLTGIGTTENEACVTAEIADDVHGLVTDDQPDVEDCDDNEVEVSPKPSQGVEAGTGTPGASLPNTSLDGHGPSPLPTIIFSLVLLASLGTLAYTNVKVVTHRKR